MPFVLLVAALPLLAAGWAVGARYFYLPSVGTRLGGRRGPGRRAGAAARRTIAGVLLLVGGLQAAKRAVTSSRMTAGSPPRGGPSPPVSAPGHRVFDIDRRREGPRPGRRRRTRPAPLGRERCCWSSTTCRRRSPSSRRAGEAAALVVAPAADTAIGRVPVRRRAGGRTGAPGRRARRCDEVVARSAGHPLHAPASRCRAAKSSSRDITDETKRASSTQPGEAGARLTPIGSVDGTLPLHKRPTWSRIDDDSVMQWPVVELAEWEELRQCPECGRHWLAIWPEEVEGGMILCRPEPATARRLRDIDRAATLRAYCLARLEEHFGQLQGAQARLPQGRLHAQAPDGTNYCVEHLIAERFGRHLAKLDAAVEPAPSIGATESATVQCQRAAGHATARK